jgi:hypothetical protein
VQKRRWLVACVLVVCSLWHGRMLWIVSSLISGESGGADFASYYYAALEAFRGGNPYDVVALNSLAGRDPSNFFAVQPYFYPPPFLLLLPWAPGLNLSDAMRVWFWLNEIALVGIFVLLLVWWRRLSGPDVSPFVLPLLAVTFVGSTFAVNLSLGQANLLVVLATLCGIYCVEYRRPVLGGVLVGLACMAKMSPALFVMWWCVQGRWRAVAAACGAALLSSVLVLPIVGLEYQYLFFADVLPSFASGDYNGLRIPIGVMGNHSIPNIYHQLLPGGAQLSSAARICSRLTTLAILGWLGWRFRRRSDELAQAAQISVVAVTLIVIPVYAYEHHLVWAVPAFGVCGIAILNQRLSRAWIAPLFISWLAWATDPALLRGPYHALREADGVLPAVLAIGLQEAKFVAILVVWAAALRVAIPTRGTPATPNSD